jgi:hypothetical protein
MTKRHVRLEAETRILTDFLLQLVNLPEVHILYVYGIDVDYVDAEVHCDWFSIW